MTLSDQLPGWADYLAIVAKAESALERLADPADPLLLQQAQKLLFAVLATGYQSAFSDPDFPDFVPAVSSVLNTVGANPDFVYGYTRIDGKGSYRLSGRRGTSAFIYIDFVAGGLGVMDDLGPSVGMLDIDTFTLTNGQFDILLSAERPADYSGDWFAVDPRATSAAIRRASYNWGEEDDGAIAIVRLDGPTLPTPKDAAAIAHHLQRLAGFVERYANFALGYSQRHRAQDYVNKLEHDDWAGRGGVAGQHYYQGIFRLKAGEAMIIDTALPEQVLYWNIQVNDALWNTVDWINRQSSLNAKQAALDSDGRFRAVIAPSDPGVPNWIDTGGLLEGSLMLRWTGASSGPVPAVSIVPIAEIRTHLPADTPKVSTEQRRVALQQRRRGAQLRRRW
ncbi:MAG: hypothetical protein JWM78_3678 [Verrucomicrobiaceae bacterium]|nr:hypothetical protein [Verrucomicrobiaceae bacterium]